MSRRDANQEQAMASIPLFVSKQRSRLADFVTLTKPGVMMLAVFTAIVGLTIAPGDLSPLRACIAVLAIAAGAGAAGVLNMWYDADIDAVMTRTARRPIPSGRIGQGEALAPRLVQHESGRFLAGHVRRHQADVASAKAETVSGPEAAISGTWLTQIVNKHAAEDALFAADDGTAAVWMRQAGLRRHRAEGVGPGAGLHRSQEP
jgi:hypothetical protein